MAGPYDQFSRGQSAGSPRRRRGGPTLEDYETLVAAYQDLQTRYKEVTLKVEEQEKQLQSKEEALQIKNDAFQMQKADLQKLEAQHLWTKAALEQAQEKIEGRQANSAEEQSWHERYVRLQAEVENMRKRWEQRYHDETTSERNRVLADMIPLADHLELALQYAGNQSEDPQIAESSFFKRFVSNIKATQQAFLTTLKRYNVEPISAVGQPFNPHLHEAVGHLPAPEVPVDHVAQVVQTGYVNGERLLRPARVLISGSK